MPAPYPLEFRHEGVALLRRSGKSVPQLASELGVSPQSLRNWARQIDINEGRRDGLSSDERDELRRLRREVRTLTEEREILKKRVERLMRQAAITGMVARKRGRRRSGCPVTTLLGTPPAGALARIAAGERLVTVSS